MDSSISDTLYRLDVMSRDGDRKTEVVWSSKYEGRKMFVTKMSIGELFWFCGYVETFPTDLMSQHKNAWDIPIDVYGGITFNGTKDGVECIGFDTNYGTDKDIDFAIEETKRMAEELHELSST